MNFSEGTLRDYLALWQVMGIGPTRFNALVNAFPCLNEVFTASETQLKSFRLSADLIKQIQQPDWAAVDHALTWALQPGRSILTWNDDHYPYLLKQIPYAPPILFVQGEVQRLSKPQIAMVGSRNPTPTGKKNAFEFAYHLAQQGLGITSGLALGVDGASHRGALEAKGITVAVVGTGLDSVYPLAHQKLAEEISATGVVVSEYPLGVGAKPRNFPRRNRIISGLSLGTLVIEAALGSGSLITAKHALEQGREVFAMPGSIHSPLSRGCHALIRQGAKLVETVEDIWDEIKMPLVHQKKERDHTFKRLTVALEDNDYTVLMNAMDFSSVSIDELVTRTGLTSAALSSMLLILELEGQVAVVPGGYVRNYE